MADPRVLSSSQHVLSAMTFAKNITGGVMWRRSTGNAKMTFERPKLLLVDISCIVTIILTRPYLNKELRSMALS
jgi:hypothetical protein